MLKRLIVLTLSLALLTVWLPAHAQRIEQRVTASSGRYALTMPAGWVATDENFGTALQGFFLNEDLTVASSSEALAAFDPAFDVTENPPTNPNGAVMAATAWAGALLEEASINTAIVMQNIATTFDSPIEQLDAPNQTGAMTSAQIDGVWLWFMTLQDKTGNQLLLQAYSDAANAAAMEAVLRSIQLFDFNDRALLNPQDLQVPIRSEVHDIGFLVPDGWWGLTIEEDGSALGMPIFDIDFVTRVSAGDIAATTGLFIGTGLNDNDDIPLEVFNADGSPNIEYAREVFNSPQALAEQAADEIIVEPWANGDQQGLTAEVTSAANDGVVFSLYVLDGDQIKLVIATASVESWAVYAETVRAIFDTARVGE